MLLKPPFLFMPAKLKESPLSPLTKQLLLPLTPISRKKWLEMEKKELEGLRRNLFEEKGEYTPELTPQKMGFHIESLVAQRLKCPACGSKMEEMPPNNPAFDLICPNGHYTQVKSSMGNKYFCKKRGRVPASKKGVEFMMDNKLHYVCVGHDGVHIKPSKSFVLVAKQIDSYFQTGERIYNKPLMQGKENLVNQQEFPKIKTSIF